MLASRSEQVALPVDVVASSGSCEILDLVLGPLELDLPGLRVHLDTVHLDITAQQGYDGRVGARVHERTPTAVDSLTSWQRRGG